MSFGFTLTFSVHKGEEEIIWEIPPQKIWTETINKSEILSKIASVENLLANMYGKEIRCVLIVSDQDLPGTRIKKNGIVNL